MSLRWCVHELGFRAAVRRVRELGVSAVELCGMSGPDVDWWRDEGAGSGLTAVSVHAPCPDGSDASRQYPGDWFLDDDPQRRAAAVSYAVDSIRFARQAGIRHVVYHLGSYQRRELFTALVDAVDAGGPQCRAARQARGAYLQGVEQAATAVRDRLRSTVERLLTEAGEDVVVCLENRYRHDQAPSPAGVVALAEEFRSPALGYWHDTGHEAAQRHLGVWDNGAADAALQLLAGMHLHDCGGVDDHRPPGEGYYDFSPILARRAPSMPLVLELASSASAERVLAGIAFLDRLARTGRR
ncbi:TIM barrel protein [Dactylosporangium sp. NPDC051485]|uniref:sugar phosphate isomerase/epimerase family protein n=1 Tax=Dactylosporangium sp. NPDC051485 TaxID=3154846 RepID=UPI0034231DBB